METNGAVNGSYNNHLNSAMDQSNDGSRERRSGEKIHASKEQDDDRKLFVGGVDFKTTEEGLTNYFSQFGKVLDVDLKKEVETQRPRGFAFVMFESKEGCQKVLSQNYHQLDGKTIDPKIATPLKKPEKKRKLFVAGVGDSTEEQIREFFSTFGELEEIHMPKSQVPGKPANYAFVTFQTSDAAQECLRKNRQPFINGKKCELSEAVSKEERFMQQQKMRDPWAPGFQGGRPGFGGGGFGRQAYHGFNEGYNNYGNQGSYGGYHGGYSGQQHGGYGGPESYGSGYYGHDQSYSGSHGGYGDYGSYGSYGAGGAGYQGGYNNYQGGYGGYGK